MNMKIKSFLILILFLCFAWGCGDEGVLLDGLVPTAPVALPDVGPVPPEIQDIIWGKDVDTLMAELEYAIDIDDNGSFIDKDGQKFYDPNGMRAKSLIHKICYRREQEAYYRKYINVGGVAIMGHEYIIDRIFYAARDIVLGMTFKRPELRELLSPMRENRSGATQLDGIHDVTGHVTPGRRFRMILIHNDMDATSAPENHLGHGLAHFRVVRASGVAGSNFGWSYVGGYSHLEEIGIYKGFCHEFAHAIHFAIRLLDPTFDDRLQASYAAAKENGSYFPEGGYALSTPMEYWASSATHWFGDMAREEFWDDLFRKTDPLMYALLGEWFDPIHLRLVESRVYE